MERAGGEAQGGAANGRPFEQNSSARGSQRRGKARKTRKGAMAGWIMWEVAALTSYHLQNE
jgi:hypothetical protein